jgi:hypothetical protein
MTNKELEDLKERLENSEAALKKLKSESSILKKAIWDMINYSQMYVIVLDEHLIIRLINWSLATDLGFEGEKDAVGQCWLDFVPETSHDQILTIHNSIAYNKNIDKYREVVSEIKSMNDDIINVKWFNTHINSHYNMTFSMGLKLEKLTIERALSISEDSIRSYYRDIIEKDRTMIKSLKDVILNKFSGTFGAYTYED